MTTYQSSGVDIAAGARATELMADAVRSTHGQRRAGRPGRVRRLLRSRGSAGRRAGAAPVLVASTDGVGTKTLVAAALGRYDTVGQDLVNHCINDILAQGARPLFFLDYIAMAKLDPQQVAEVVGGWRRPAARPAARCWAAKRPRCRMSIMPGAFDLAGTIVGVVERDAMLLPRDVPAGDAILALPSSGLHTNGYSLARRVFGRLGYDERPAELGGQIDRRGAAGDPPRLPARGHDAVGGRRADPRAGAYHRRRPVRQPAARAAERPGRGHPARVAGIFRRSSSCWCAWASCPSARPFTRSTWAWACWSSSRPMRPTRRCARCPRRGWSARLCRDDVELM